MIGFFAAHPTAANILMFIIVLLGIASLPGLNKETFPEIELNQIEVTVPYPGASAAEVEEGICNRLEDSTDGISFLEERSCEARDNVGNLVLSMQEAGDLQAATLCGRIQRGSQTFPGGWTPSIRAVYGA